MKKKFTAIALICTLTAFGQTTEMNLQNELSKPKQKELKETIKDYNKAIKDDDENEDAYYNRGTCELELRQFNSAVKDFTKTIELDPTFPKAYYHRAKAYVSLKRFIKALSDLDKALELDIKTPNALILRGQVRFVTGDKKGALDDFNTAKQIGDIQADKYIFKYFGSKEQSK